jgi:uncharacterized protein (DUF302 family)
MIEFGLGFLTGTLGRGLIAWQVMPAMMLDVRESPYDTVEETCDRLAQSIEAHGWSNQAVRNMNASMARHDVPMDRTVRVVELCNAHHAKTVLRSNPEVSTMMPCAWGVYEGDDGNVYVSGMNMGLMGQLFGGTIADVMGGAVAEEEEEMLEEALVPGGSSAPSRNEPTGSRSVLRETGRPGGDGLSSGEAVQNDRSDVNPANDRSEDDSR